MTKSKLKLVTHGKDTTHRILRLLSYMTGQMIKGSGVSYSSTNLFAPEKQLLALLFVNKQVFIVNNTIVSGFIVNEILLPTKPYVTTRTPQADNGRTIVIIAGSVSGGVVVLVVIVGVIVGLTVFKKRRQQYSQL